MREQRSINTYLKRPWVLTGGNFEAPAILIREGVHAGSAGPIFWPPHVLRAAAPSWEGIPVTINHPVDSKGVPISVNTSQEVKAAYVVGKVVRPHYDAGGKAIKAILQVPADHPMAENVQKLREVSVGVFGDHTQTYGEYQGESYKKCAISMEPDHLAILDGDSIGACSFEKDGCGIRTNAAADDGHLHVLQLRPWPEPDEDPEDHAVYPPEVM